MMEVTNITVICGDEVFLVQRSGDVDHKGKWAAPGGEVDAGETPAQGALRELLEETEIDLADFGISADDLTEAPIFEDENTKLHSFYVSIPESAKENFVPKLNFENDDAQWMKIDDIPESKRILPNFVSALNYIIRWEIGSDFIPIGRRPGKDVLESGSEKDVAEISALGQRLFDRQLKDLAKYQWQKEGILEKLREAEPKAIEFIDKEQAIKDELYTDLADIRNAVININKVQIRGEKAPLLDMLFDKDQNTLNTLESFTLSKSLEGGDKYDFDKFKGNGRYNPFKAITKIRSRMEKASEGVELIRETTRKYSVSEQRLLTMAEEAGKDSTDYDIEFVLRYSISDIHTERGEFTDQLHPETRYHFLPQNFHPEGIAAFAEKVGSFEPTLSGTPSELNFVTRQGLAQMDERCREVLIQAVAYSGMRFATPQERVAAVANELIEQFRENPAEFELNTLPEPREGKQYVFHGTANLFAMPSEIYSNASTSHRTKTADKTLVGSKFDGFGFYTTTSPARVMTYKGGSSTDKIKNSAINGIHILVYEVGLNEDNTMKGGTLSEEQRDRVDTRLQDKGTSIAKLCEKHDYTEEAVTFNKRSPLIVEFGAEQNTRILSEAGILATTPFDISSSNTDRIIIDISALKVVTRVELDPAASIKDVINEYAGVDKEFDDMEADEVCDRYLDLVFVNNKGLITNYHTENLKDGLGEAFNLSGPRADAAINASVDKLADRKDTGIEVEDVYVGRTRARAPKQAAPEAEL